MKCQILFSGKNKKNISKCRLLKFLPRVLRVNLFSMAIVNAYMSSNMKKCTFERVCPAKIQVNLHIHAV